MRSPSSPLSFLPVHFHSYLTLTPVMTSISQRQKGRSGVLPTFDVFIQVLSIAKDSCGIPPAQIALGAACVLLTMIRVYLILLCEHQPPTQVSLGHHG